MKFYGRKRKNYRRKAAPKKRTYKRRAVVSAAVKQYVSRSIKVASENKVVNWRYNGNLYNFNATGSQWYTYNFFQLSPNNITLPIAQNSTAQGRIGNEIKMRSGMIKFVLVPNQYDALLNPLVKPMDIRIVMGYSKQQPVTGPVYSDFTNYYFQTGSSSSGPNLNLIDCVSDINKDVFTICYDKKVKLGYSQLAGALGAATFSTSGVGVGGQTANQYLSNNDYKFNVIRKINITKYLSKIYKYNDNLTYPSSGKGLFIWYMISNADGSYVSPGSNQAQLFLDVDLHFED